MAISTDPNRTRGRAGASGGSLTFPLSESPAMMTRLRFVSYSRFEPSSTTTETTTTIITLPLPQSVVDRSSLKHQNTDLGVYGNMDLSSLNQSIDARSLEPLIETGKLGIAAITESMKRMEDNFKDSLLKGLALNPLIGDGDRRNLGMLAGVIQNPHTNLAFDGVELRRHQFNWRLSARSQDESDALKRIIDTIKLRIHPAEAAGGYALDYPDLLFVEYTGAAANYLPVVRKSMVNEFTAVPQSDGGSIPMYKSGAPVIYDLTLSVCETEIVTRNDLEDEVGIEV